MANELLTPTWKARFIVPGDLTETEHELMMKLAASLDVNELRAQDARRIWAELSAYAAPIRSASEKVLLVRIAEWSRRWSKGDPLVAAISMADLAGDCALTEAGLRGVLRRYQEHIGCPHHLDVQGGSGKRCDKCRREFRRQVGCLRIVKAETATRARRYALLLDRLRGKRGFPLGGLNSLPDEGNAVSPGGQPGFPDEGNAVSPGGQPGFPVPYLPLSVPDFPEKITGADAPARFGGEKEGETGQTRRPTIHDDPEALERVHRELLERRAAIESKPYPPSRRERRVAS